MGLLTFDDRDPLVSYSTTGNWQQGGVSQEYNATTTWTIVGGATVTLTFTGTNVAVYGTIANIGLGTAPQTSYSVDGWAPTLYNATMQSSIQYQQKFFQSQDLSPSSQHTLVVRTVGDGGYFYLDYFQVVPVDGSAGRVSGSSSSSSSSSLTATSSSSSSSGSSSGLTATSTSVSSMSSTSSSSSTSASASNTKAAAESQSAIQTDVIIGLVVMALGVLAFVFVVILVMRRRRKKAFRKKKFDETEIQSLWTRPQSSASSQVTPFLMDPAPPPLANSDPNTISPFPLYPQFTNSITPAPSISSLNATSGWGGGSGSGKGGIVHGGLQYAPLPLPGPQAQAQVQAQAGPSTSLVVPGRSGKRQEQQQPLLDHGTESTSMNMGSTSGWGSGSASTSSLSGHTQTHARTDSAVSNSQGQGSGSGSSTVQTQAQPGSGSVAGYNYDNPFEPPPPGYNTYA